MFVSSYNTYISTNTSDRTQKHGAEKSGRESASFDTKLSTKPTQVLNKLSNLPIDYVSNYKSYNNQQKLQEQTQDFNKTKFTKMTAMSSAKVAYEDNSKLFSLLQKPHATQDQTPKIDKKLPKEIQEIKEKNLRHTMVNTYLANDNYYQITA